MSQIASMLGIGRATLYRRLTEWSLQLERFQDITDQELDNVVASIYHRHAHCGIAMMQGHLIYSGIYVQRSRIRASIRRVDPINSVLRWGLVTRRRRYSVPGPQSLWHIDGHHALIRWRIVTHGGIDGYSRMIVFLHSSDNNRSDTVRSLFVQAIECYGLPAFVRAHRGGENVSIRVEIDSRCGPGHFIAGRSVDNCTIERLWRDLYYVVIQTFYSLLYFLEAHYPL